MCALRVMRILAWSIPQRFIPGFKNQARGISIFFPATLQVETCTICHTFFQSVPSNILDNACFLITEYYYRSLPDLFGMFFIFFWFRATIDDHVSIMILLIINLNSRNLPNQIIDQRMLTFALSLIITVLHLLIFPTRFFHWHNDCLPLWFNRFNDAISLRPTFATTALSKICIFWRIIA